MKNSDLISNNDIVSALISPRKNPNIASDSPTKEGGDKSSTTFVVVVSFYC